MVVQEKKRDRGSLSNCKFCYNGLGEKLLLLSGLARKEVRNTSLVDTSVERSKRDPSSRGEPKTLSGLDESRLTTGFYRDEQKHGTLVFSNSL
jgi:hypothetical protein